MKWVVALLAAALLLTGVAGCGGDGAEPGAPIGATLVLDFTPNPAHAGIYSAQHEGYYRDAGVDLSIRQPGESTDAPSCSRQDAPTSPSWTSTTSGSPASAGSTLVGVTPIVQRPLASMIAA